MAMEALRAMCCKVLNNKLPNEKKEEFFRKKEQSKMMFKHENSLHGEEQRTQ